MRGVPLRYSVRNLWRRPARTVLTLAGLSVVVALIVFLTAFGRSFARALRIPGDPRTLIALSKKAQTFELSSIPPGELDAMASELSDSLETGPGGRPLFAKGVHHFTNLRLDRDPEGRPRRASIHGLDPAHAKTLVPGFALLDGRLPDPDRCEALAGRNAADFLDADPAMLGIGSEFRFREQVFTVTGTFAAPGTLYENWILMWPDDLRFAINRPDYSFARMKVREGVDLEALAERLSLDERYQVNVLPETEYFADFLEGFSSFQRFSVLLAVILGVAGGLTGMNTLHNAVVGRIREIGTLRVLGFDRRRILLAFLLEALLLTGMAGAVGCGLGMLADGLPVRVPIAARFPVVVDGTALAVGFAAALAMGALGLVFPMARALRMPAVEAVRAA